MISKYNIHIYIKEIFSLHMSYKFRYYKSYPLKNNLVLEICKKRDATSLV
jgi:hypothetical protein